MPGVLQVLHLHFEFYDFLLIAVVTAFGTLSAYLRDPQLKAVTATVPIPFGFTYIAIGLPIGAPNAGGAFLCLLYVHIVRILTYRAHVPVVFSIAAGIITFIVLGALLLPVFPGSDAFFLGICAFDFALGVILFQTQTYRKGTRYRTPLPVYIKAPIVAAVVAGLMVLKKLLGGFATSFPMMNSVVSYESRLSLGDQCRQLPIFLIAAPFMFIAMHYIEALAHLNHWIVLVIGFSIFMAIYYPLNKELKKRIQRNA